jgi:hypothetical protein
MFSSNPHKGCHFYATFNWFKAGNERDNGMLLPNWHFCMCCNPANRSVDFDESFVQSQKSDILNILACVGMFRHV